MDPGELNVRGSIESKAVTKGASGGMVETWTPLAGMPVYARVRHVDGHAIERPVTAGAGGEVSIGRTVIRIRYRAGVTAQMRFVIGTTVYNVKRAANFQERNEWLDLTCEMGVNRG
jgi:SPP1 family predicted phage head-tail adaptor